MASDQKCGASTGKHECQRQRYGAQLRFGGGGAGEHGPAAGQPAEDDVQPGAALQPDGVNDGVKKAPEEDVHRRPGVEREPGGADRDDGQCGNDHQPQRTVLDFTW